MGNLVCDRCAHSSLMGTQERRTEKVTNPKPKKDQVLKQHTGKEYEWIDRVNFENACHYYFDELSRIENGENPNIPVQFLSHPDSKRLQKFGVLIFRKTGYNLEDYKLTERAKEYVAQIRANRNNMTPI